MVRLRDMAPPNQVRAARARLRLSQLELAERAGLSRQSVGAIEGGRATPSVDVALRLARALGAGVEALFGARPDERVAARREAPFSGRAAVAQVDGRWVTAPLDPTAPGAPAGGIVDGERDGAALVSPLSPLAELAENVLVLGCAAGLGVLAARLTARRGAGRFVWLPRSSQAALRALASRHAHVAGLHLVDEETGEHNIPDVRRARCPEALTLVTLASWEAGLVVRAGDPRAPRRAGDLGRPGLRVVGRPEGAGAQRLLERTVRRARLPAAIARRPTLVVEGHLDVARAVAMGAADVGVASRDAALALGLGFVPLATERYDLALPRASLLDPRVQRLLDELCSAEVRRELSALGYDASAAGARVAEVA
ncbi:MAG: helix-turn-helix domain-containing protein [Polyangiaceae bacterium]|nr:helix-turn-helix domain-containing protein [Polyangiaceae bacterium]